MIPVTSTASSLGVEQNPNRNSDDKRTPSDAVNEQHICCRLDDSLWPSVAISPGLNANLPIW
jgi:hypothetical protein